MALPDIEMDLYDKLIERNRNHILRYINANVFFDTMREKSILSMNDVEEIQNKGYTRRDRAGIFLDKLQTKGNNGVIAFLEILEYEYAPVYKLLTDKEAREPPPTYCKHRESFYASWLYKLPQLAEDLKKDYELKRNLNQKFQEMEEILKFAQENNRELERDNEELRKRLDISDEEKTRTEKQLGDCMKERDRCRDMSLEHLQNCVQFQQERDHYKERWRDVVTERDDLELQLRARTNVTPSHKEGLTASERRRSFGSQKAQAPPPVIPPKPSANRQKENLKVQIEILDQELNQMREKCEELSLDLIKTQEELDLYQERHKMAKQSYERLRKEKDKQDGWLEDKRKRVEEYFSKIEQLEQEKRNLEEERNKEQAKRKEEAEKSFILFREKHELENKYEELKSKYETMKVQCNRNSSDNSLPDDAGLKDAGLKSPENDPSTDYKTPPTPTSRSNTLPSNLNPDYSGMEGLLYSSNTISPRHRQAPQIPVEMGYADVQRCHMQRSDTVQAHASKSVREKDVTSDDRHRVDSSVFYTVAKHCRTLDQVQVSDNSESNDLRPRRPPVSSLSCPVESISDTSEESDSTELFGFDVATSYLPKKWKQFPNMTFSDDTITVKLNRPVLNDKLCIIGGNYTGIYISEITKNASDKLCVGDNILSVAIVDSKSYLPLRQTVLKGCTLEEAVSAFRYERDKGIKTSKEEQVQVEITVKKTKQFVFHAIKEWMKENNSSGDYFFIRCNLKRLEERLPDAMNVNKGDVLRITNTHIEQDSYWKGQMFDQLNCTWTTEGMIPKELRKYMPEGRRAFRLRIPPFTRVLPMKANAKLPVSLYGDSNLINMIQIMMVDDSPDYCLCNDMNGKERPADLLKYYLLQGRHVLIKDVTMRTQYCFINIYINTENTSHDVLRKLFGDVNLEKCNHERIPDDSIYETVNISSQGISSKESLLKAIHNKVQKGQDCVYWMCGDKIDSSIAQQYKYLLGSEEVTTEKQEKGIERSASTPT